MDRRSQLRLLWAARVLGGVMLLFLLYMLFGHWFGAEELDTPFRDTADRLAYLFFPWGVALGLALAYWRPLAGGLFVLLCMGGLFLLRPDLVDSVVLAFALPGLLHVLAAVAGMGRPHEPKR